MRPRDMRLIRHHVAAIGRSARFAACALTACLNLAGCGPSGPVPAPDIAAPSALSVDLARLESSDWPMRASATGAIMPYDEFELTAPGELPLRRIEARVGERVSRNQVLARFDTASLLIKRSDAQASVAQARATLEQAVAQYDGLRMLDASGSISRQELIKARTQQEIGQADLQGAQARLKGIDLQLRRAWVRAPDDGVIASSDAIEGAVPSAGSALFRIIRRGRLEWRAQLGAQALGAIRPGQPAELTRADGVRVRGVVRQVAPVLDKRTLAGLVFVDLPADSGLYAGDFVAGGIDTGRSEVMTLPGSAVLARDGLHYVWSVDAQARVHMRKIAVGRSRGGRIEVLSGLKPGEPVVGEGVGLLGEGDRVTVLAAAGSASRQGHDSPATDEVRP